MATHSSILAGRIPWTLESGGLQSKGSHRVGHEHAGIILFLASSTFWNYFPGRIPGHHASPLQAFSLLPFCVLLILQALLCFSLFCPTLTCWHSLGSLLVLPVLSLHTPPKKISSIPKAQSLDIQNSSPASSPELHTEPSHWALIPRCHKCASNLACPKVNSLPPPTEWHPSAPVSPLSANGTSIGRLLDLPTPENHPSIPLLPFCLTSPYSINLCICQLSFQCISGNRYLFSPFGSLSLFFNKGICIFIYFFEHIVQCVELSWPGIELELPAMEVWSLNHWTARDVLSLVLFFLVLIIIICLRIDCYSLLIGLWVFTLSFFQKQRYSVFFFFFFNLF